MKQDDSSTATGKDRRFKDGIYISEIPGTDCDVRKQKAFDTKEMTGKSSAGRAN